MSSPANLNITGVNPDVNNLTESNTLDLGSSRLPAEYDLVAMYAGHVIAKQLSAAFLTLVAWDFALTMDTRFRLFWGGRWTITKIMYVMNRYTALFTLGIILMNMAVPSPSILYCNAAPWALLVGTDISFAIIGFAMITRVYALWNRNKWILTSVCSLCFLHISYYTTTVTYAFSKGILMPANLPFTGCFITLGFDKLWTMLVPTLVFETVIVSLIVYKTWSLASQRSIKAPLFTMLFNDGLIYYLAIIAIQILSLVSLLVPSNLTIPIVRAYPTFAVTGIASNRLFTRLHLLLLGKSTEQSGLSTIDAWSVAIPDSTYGGGRTDSEAPYVRPRVTRKKGYQRHHSITNFDGEVGMEPMGKVTLPHREEALTGELGPKIGSNGYLEDIAAQPGGKWDYPVQDVRVLHGPVPRVEVMVNVDGNGPGPFAYGKRESILDPSPWRGHSSKQGNEDVGSIIVSRMGRYD